MGTDIHMPDEAVRKCREENMNTAVIWQVRDAKLMATSREWGEWRCD